MNKKEYKIAVIGAGYVGMSLSLALSKKNNIMIVDTDFQKVKNINKKISSVDEQMMNEYIKRPDINLKATLNMHDACLDAQFIFLAISTDFNADSNRFDTSDIESLIKNILIINKKAIIIIKSTIPIGFTADILKKNQVENIIFSPEFLREGSALEDNLNPKRIILGGNIIIAEIVKNLLKDSLENIKDAHFIFTSSTEAESIKLFSNAYLAMRVSFFNEIDNFAIKKNISTKNIIDGVSSDNRIGDYYNNPSFGYGGYCLPKDSMQLLSDFADIPQDLIQSIISSNIKRKEFIANEIILLKPSCVGIYRLQMKTGSDNFRNAAIIDIMKLIKNNNIPIMVYEPLLNSNEYNNIEVEKCLDTFKIKSEIILANRIDHELKDVEDKIYSRDIYNND